MKKLMKKFLEILTENRLILGIVFLAFFLRVYKVETVPPGLTWDEAALGYNGYSILKTGRDEYGKFLPLIFKSFGDYKPGLYVYLTVPSILFFGLNEFAVRLPSVVAGTLLVGVLSFLIREFFGSNRGRLAFLTAVVAAISPWLIHFSRGAWEANVAVLEVVLGIYFFIKLIKTRKQIWGFNSSVFFGLTYFTYQGAKAFSTLLFLGLLTFWLKDLKKFSFSKAKLFVPILVGFILINFGLFIGQTSGRIKVMSLFSYRRPLAEVQKIKNEEDESRKWAFPIFHSESLSFLRGFLGRYFNYFSGRFLFFEGDWSSKRHGPPYTGMLLLTTLPFLGLGIYDLFSRQRNNLENFLLYWLLVAPIPAALTRDSIQAVRSLPMAIPLVFLTATGVDYFLFLIKSAKFLFLGKLILILMLSLNLIYYLDLYFVHYPLNSYREWLVGYKEIMTLVKEKQKLFPKVIITQKLGQPYIFYLFFLKYPPQDYQKQAYLVENSSGDVGEVRKINNLEFRPIYFPADRGLSKALFIGDEFELPSADILGNDKFQVLKEIKYPDGSIPFRIVGTK